MSIVWAGLIWVAGFLTLVPYATYYLFYYAPKEEYALLITLVLFWIFGYWGIAGPILALIKLRAVYRNIERAQAQGKLLEGLRSTDTEEVMVDFIATENRIPRFVAARIYRVLASRIEAAPRAPKDTAR